MPRKKALPEKKIERKKLFLAVFLVFVNIAILAFLAIESLHILIGSPFFAGRMRALTLHEQEEHREAMLGIIGKIGEDTDILKNDFENLKERRIMDLRDKEDTYRHIDDLEKDIKNLDIEYIQYATDVSVDINPYKDQGIEDFMAHSKNLQVKAGRLAGYMESFIYAEKQSTDDQVSLMEKTFANTYWEIDTLENE
ncbi:MAG: hypothetical protein HGB08_01720 [Candidatus Moranbacteria bacterium]|nr:hypothetical protein [Candidatus Moranbacteria bacterium]